MIKTLDRSIGDDFHFVLSTVTREGKVSAEDIRDGKRDQDVVTARKVLQCILRRSGYRLKDIASVSRNTHSSVSINTKAFSDLYDYDERFRKLYLVCLSEYNMMVKCDENSMLIDESVRLQIELDQYAMKLKSLKQKLINNQNKLKWQKNSM